MCQCRHIYGILCTWSHRTTLLVFYEVRLWNKTAVTTPDSRKLPNDQKSLGMPSGPPSWSTCRETCSSSAELSLSFLATMYQSIRLPNTHVIENILLPLCELLHSETAGGGASRAHGIVPQAPALEDSDEGKLTSSIMSSPLVVHQGLQTSTSPCLALSSLFLK